MKYNISQQEAQERILIKRALRKEGIPYKMTEDTQNLLKKLGADVYQMPQGDWAANAHCIMTDGFETRKDAIHWVYNQFKSRPKEGGGFSSPSTHGRRDI